MPIFFDATKKRKWLFRATISVFFIALLACLAALNFNLFFSKTTRPPVRYADTIEAYHYYYSAANDKKIALTIDDGPQPGITELLMDTLERRGVPATFFHIGRNALLNPQITQTAGGRGFSIGNHSLTHRPTVHDSKRRLARELHATDLILSNLAGTDLPYYRPPFLLGIGIDPTVNPYIPIPDDMFWVLQQGYLPIGSDIDPEDWRASSADEVLTGLERALRETLGGRIVLLHEVAHTAEALDGIITLLQDEGYTIVPLAELLTPPDTIRLDHMLAVGDTDATTGGEVSKLQWFLYQEGDLNPYLLSGIFGEETRAALTRFQLRAGLIDSSGVDPERLGVVDAETNEAINTHSAGLAAAVALTPIAAAPQQTLYDSASTAVKKAYISFFPGLRALLIGTVGLTLVLVVARSIFLFGLLFIGWRRSKKPVAGFKLSKEQKKRRGVSVLVPAYNEAENIRGTLESIIRSRYSRREIIVIDDGSTDGTGEKVHEFIAENPGEQIRLARVRNGGKAQALNHGIDLSRYRICVVLDADAVLDPSALNYFMRHFANPAVGAVAGKVRTTGSRRLLDLFQTLEYAIGQNIDKKALSVLGAVGVVPGPAGAWDRSAVMKLGGFSSDTLVEDQDMTLRLLRAGKQVIYEPNAIAYTETPNTVSNFLKQRFRWIFGTMQCFWKNRGVFIEQPLSIMSLVVMTNIFAFNILLPLTYPFADGALIYGLISSEWKYLVVPFLIFTVVDLLYASFGIRGEPGAWRLLWAVPLQRVMYRQLLYYTVARSVVRALEGSGLGWNKFAKAGETQRFYFSSLKEHPAYQEMPEKVTVAFQGPSGTFEASTNRHDVTELVMSPKQSHSAGEISSPAPSLYVLTGSVDEPNTYAKSSVSNGPTSSH